MPPHGSGSTASPVCADGRAVATWKYRAHVPRRSRRYSRIGVEALLGSHLVPQPDVHCLRGPLAEAPGSVISSTFTFASPRVVSIFPSTPTTASLTIRARRLS